MTCWYAAASEAASAQFGPSLVPDQPPNDTMTSPPAARMPLITPSSTSPCSGRRPSQAGVQPPPDSMNAMVNHFTPVAAMTAGASGGAAQWYRYGAAAIAPLAGGG